MKMVGVKSYTEAGSPENLPVPRLTLEQYGLGLQTFVPACSDVAAFDKSARTIYLAWRISKPLSEAWWWIGGRVDPTDDKEDAAIRNFERETKIKLSRDRLNLRAVFDYRWKDRQQAPQELGCHMVGYTFTVELSQEEISALERELDTAEYDPKKGLRPFNRAQLVEANVHPAVLDLYDLVFNAHL